MIERHIMREGYYTTRSNLYRRSSYIKTHPIDYEACICQYDIEAEPMGVARESHATTPPPGVGSALFFIQ